MNVDDKPALARRLTAARQKILDKMAGQQRIIANAQETLGTFAIELHGFDAALAAMNEPEPASGNSPT